MAKQFVLIRSTRRFLICGMALLVVGVAASYAAKSQPAAEKPGNTVRVKRVPLFENAPVGVSFHLGWLSSACFECASANSTHQVGLTMEVWKDGELVEKDSPKGVWVATAKEKPFDTRASITVMEYPGNMLMLRRLNIHTGGGVRAEGTLEVRKPASDTSGRRYGVTSLTDEIILTPGEEKTVWAMIWKNNNSAWSLNQEDDGTLTITEEDKSIFAILFKMKLYPWYVD